MTNTHENPEDRVVVIREGAASRRPGELSITFLEDTNDLTNWFDRDTDARDHLARLTAVVAEDEWDDDDPDILHSLVNDAEMELAEHGYEVEWDDGYVITRTEG